MRLRLSFQQRVTLVLIFTMLLVVTIAGFAIDYVARRALIAESERSMLELVKTAEATVTGQLNQVAAYPQVLGALAITLDSEAEQRLNWYHETIPAMFAAMPPDILSLTTFFEPGFIAGREYAKVWYVREPSGRLREITVNAPGEPGYDPQIELYNYFEQEWYTTPVAQMNTTWSEPYFDAGGANVNMVTVSVPVMYQGSLAGVATADVQLDAISTFLERIKPTPDSYALLISSNGTFIAHPQNPELVLVSTIGEAAATLESAELAALGETILAGNSGLSYLHDPFTGMDVVAAYQTISATGWSIVMLTPESALVQPVTQLRSALFVIAVLALTIVAVSGWFSVAILLHPVTRLVQGVEQFAENRNTIRFNITSNDEIGQLARAFETMSGQIGQAYTNLEQEVATRTEALRNTLEERDQQARDLSRALDEVRRKDQEILSLSIPVVPLLRDTLVLPIVGVLNDERARQMTQALLEAVEQHKARVVIIDLTGLAAIDTLVAQQIMQAAQAVSLLGAEVTLVGLSSEVAQTIVSMGIAFDNLQVYADLQAAVTAALKRPYRQHVT